MDSNNSSIPFQNMHQYIHVDEKWFYLTQTNKNVYLCLNEDPPHRTIKSKRFIPKVMFLAAVARPRHNFHTKAFFDGKVGFWPFAEWVPAKRNSRNRPAGTLELKPVTVTKEVYQSFLFDKLFPAIRDKWPETKHIPIYVQQHNAKLHILNDQMILNKGRQNGWNIC